MPARRRAHAAPDTACRARDDSDGRHRGPAGVIIGRSVGHDDPRRRRAHVRHRVDGAVRRVAGRVRAEVVDRDRERQLDVERRVAVHTYPPPGRPQVPGRFDVVVQYQLTVKRITSLPSLRPTITVRCAAIVPAGNSPAASVVVSRAAATSPALDQSSTGRPAASASSASDGENSPRRNAERRGSKDSIGRPKPISSNNRCGESRRDMLANSSISIRSTRRCIDNNAYGSASVMKPGLLPVA